MAAFTISDGLFYLSRSAWEGDGEAGGEIYLKFPPDSDENRCSTAFRRRYCGRDPEIKFREAQRHFLERVDSVRLLIVLVRGLDIVIAVYRPGVCLVAAGRGIAVSRGSLSVDFSASPLGSKVHIQLLDCKRSWD
jgi:hypothetical protein